MTQNTKIFNAPNPADSTKRPLPWLAEACRNLLDRGYPGMVISEQSARSLFNLSLDQLHDYWLTDAGVAARQHVGITTPNVDIKVVEGIRSLVLTIKPMRADLQPTRPVQTPIALR